MAGQEEIRLARRLRALPATCVCLTDAQETSSSDTRPFESPFSLLDHLLTPTSKNSFSITSQHQPPKTLSPSSPNSSTFNNLFSILNTRKMADQEPTDEVLQFILDLKAENLNFKRTLDRMDKKLQECMDKGVDAAAINSIRMMVNNIHTPVTDVYDGTDSLEARAYRDLETYDQLSEDEKTTGQMWKATRRMIKGRKSGSRLLAAKKSTNKSTVGAATPATSAAPRRMQATASSQQNARPQQEQSAAAAPAAPSSHEKPGLQQGQSTASAPAASSHQQTGPQQRQSDPAGPTEAVATSSQEAPDEIMVDCPNCGKSLTLVMYLEEKEIWEGGEPWEEDELLEEGEPLEEDEEDEDDEDYEPPKSFSSGLAW